MRMTLPPSLRSSAISALRSSADFAAAGSAGLSTRNFVIFFPILIMSELPVIAFLERVEQVRGRVLLAVVFDFLVAARLDLGAVIHREHVGRVLEVLFLHENALVRLRVEAEGRAALQPLVVGIQIDVLERVV